MFVVAMMVASLSIGAGTKRAYANEVRVNPLQAQTQYTINATSGENGSIYPKGKVVVDEGDSRGFLISPRGGYHIEKVKVDGEKVELTDIAIRGGNFEYTFTDVSSDHTIDAQFAMSNTVKIFTDFTGGGHVDKTKCPAGSMVPGGVGYTLVTEGADLVLSATPDAGYKIKSFKIDGVEHVEDITTTALPEVLYIPDEREAFYKLENITKDVYFNVVFEEENTNTDYTITAISAAGGSITPVGKTVVTGGGSVSYTFMPDSGYKVKSVFVDDSQIDLSSLETVDGYYTYTL